MLYRATEPEVDALPIWTDDQRDGPYIEKWIVYPHGGPYDWDRMRIMSDIDFQKRYAMVKHPPTGNTYYIGDH